MYHIVSNEKTITNEESGTWEEAVTAYLN